MDVEEYKNRVAEQWTQSAEGWERQAEFVDAMVGAVTRKLLEEAALETGDRVLEVACGPAGVGLEAAARVAPGGHVLLTDFVSPMVEVARRRAQELGVENVDFAVIDAQDMGLPGAEFDAVLCRFGYMLMPEPARALAESRRVLKSGGRISFAVWGRPEQNPWASVPTQILMALANAPPPEPGAPGMFSLGDHRLLGGLLEEAGFEDLRVDSIQTQARYDSFEDWWEKLLELAQPLRAAATGMEEPLRSEFPAEMKRRSADYVCGGGLEFPAEALIASARAS
jgi:ubiquinone/menaquinone biosynthesis C-methylase UbiE